MRRIFAVATILTLSAFAAFAQRGAGRGMGRAGAAVPPAGAQNAHATAPRQGMPAGAQHQPGVNLTPAMIERLQPLVPQGMTIDTAAEGFRNNGQFVAALHVSQNLGIPFDQLKARVTGPEAVSLGKAIQELKPGLSKQQISDAVKIAQQQARDQERQRDRNRERTRDQVKKDQPVSK
jgi:hypothetical protein